MNRVVAEIQRVPLDECCPAHVIRPVWQELGVHGKDLDTLVALRLLQIGVTLRATSDIVGAHDFPLIADHIIFKMWRFSEFNGGRWLSTQEACAGIARGILSGLDRAVEMAQGDTRETNAFIN